MQLIEFDECMQDRQRPATAHKVVPNREVPEPSADITNYYRQTIEDYKTWSCEGYMHFGIWQPWSNPFNRQAMLEAMNDLLFSRLGLASTSCLKIADLGCGVGAVSKYGSRKYCRHHWTAVTLSPEQIEYGKTLLDPLDHERVEFLQADYNDLPIKSESLDAAFFLESLCHAEHPHTALAEAWRILKPGGRLVVVDGMMRKQPEQTPRLVNQVSRKTAENWAVGEFHNVPQFEDAVCRSGLQIENRMEIGWKLAPCVAHSPALIGVHSLKLLLTGKLTAWKRKHLIGCALGVLLGTLRPWFGYYVYSLRKPSV